MVSVLHDESVLRIIEKGRPICEGHCGQADQTMGACAAEIADLIMQANPQGGFNALPEEERDMVAACARGYCQQLHFKR